MPKSILDPAFQYTPAAATNLAKTFRRIRNEQKAEAVRRASTEAQNVQTLNPKRKANG